MHAINNQTNSINPYITKGQGSTFTPHAQNQGTTPSNLAQTHTPVSNQPTSSQAKTKDVTPIKTGITSDVKAAYDEKTLKRMGIVECSTCANRTYKDGSDDSGVSFQAPTHISPASSGSAVRSHEQEHVVREQANARENGGQVISQSVSIYTSVCPECGRSYTSGGLTRTTTKFSGESDFSSKGGMLDLSV